MSVELGGTTLTHLTEIRVRERARLVRHPVPGMSGDLSQVLGRPSVEVSFQGIFYGPQASEDLGQLRSAQLEGQPVDFFTEAVGEGYFTQVLITRLDVFQEAGYLDQFRYTCEVIEFVEPPQPAAAADLLSAIDDDLLGEAMGFVDDVQNALEEVAGLANLIAGAPSFGDPTGKLPEMLGSFQALTGPGLETLAKIRDLF